MPHSLSECSGGKKIAWTCQKRTTISQLSSLYCSHYVRCTTRDGMEYNCMSYMILKCQRISVYKTCRELCCDVCILPTLLLSISTQYMYSCVCVCVCVCVYACACICVCIFVYLNVWMFVCTVRTYGCSVCMYVAYCVCDFIYIYICMNLVCVYVCVRMYEYICVSVCFVCLNHTLNTVLE